MSMLGFGEKAFEYFRMINPIEHARTKEASKKYKVEYEYDENTKIITAVTIQILEQN